MEYPSEASPCRRKILTIPNLLSLFRLVLIPALMALARRGAALQALALLILSGLTDVADGYIARRFHMVSDLGKILDPLADKLTQAAMLWCLSARYPHMLPALVLLVAKDTLNGLLSLAAIRKTGLVQCAQWHGKAATALLYGTIGCHLLYPDLSPAWSQALTVCCILLMALSALLYFLRSTRLLRNGQQSGSPITP